MSCDGIFKCHKKTPSFTLNGCPVMTASDHLSPRCYVVTPAVPIFSRPHNKRSYSSALTHSPG